MNFKQGYYGFDSFSMFLIFLSLILNMWHWTRFLGTLIFVYALFRVFSRNTYKRKKEYDVFYSYASKILSKVGIKLPYNTAPIDFNDVAPFISNIKYKYNQRKQFKITKCPYCGQKLRIPRGKGKMTVTCKKCLKDFKFKT